MDNHNQIGKDSHDEHEHSHGFIDPSLTTSSKALFAVKWSSIILFIGSFFQLIVALFSGSISLFTDTIHNFGDAATAIPLGIAFLLGRKKENNRYTYGYGRAEDIAGMIIVIVMLISAIFAGYVSMYRLFHPEEIVYLWGVVIASLVGFGINEGAAFFRISIGKKINSQALIVDGYHARTDGLASIGVLFGAIGVWLGYPLADPIVGLIIVVIVLKTTWESAKNVFERAMDGIGSGTIDELHNILLDTKGVVKVKGLRARWIGHKLQVEAVIMVDPNLSLKNAYIIAEEAKHDLLHHNPHILIASIQLSPEE